jgi:hypothetical protein
VRIPKQRPYQQSIFIKKIGLLRATVRCLTKFLSRAPRVPLKPRMTRHKGRFEMTELGRFHEYEVGGRRWKVRSPRRFSTAIGEDEQEEDRQEADSKLRHGLHWGRPGFQMERAGLDPSIEHRPW